jgi:hypothetical protein
MAHICPVCGSKCECRQAKNDPENCIHCEMGDDWDYEEDGFEEDEIDRMYDDEKLDDPTARDPLAKVGIVEYPKDLEDE